MDEFEPKTPENLSWWIASLAMSILLCAGFAGYVFDIKEDLRNAKLRADIVEQRMDILTDQLDNMRHRMMVQQMQVNNPEKAIQLPAAAPPVAETVAPPPPPMPVPGVPPTPPSITEIPAKH